MDEAQLALATDQAAYPLSNLSTFICYLAVLNNFRITATLILDEVRKKTTSHSLASDVI